MFPKLGCFKRIDGKVPSLWWGKYAEFYRCPFHIQQYFILHSYHNSHVVIICTYFRFDIEDMNIVDFLSNVHKRKQVPSKIRKIDHIMEKKIQESGKFNPHNDNYQGFETWFIHKIKYEIYTFTEIIFSWSSCYMVHLC